MIGYTSCSQASLFSNDKLEAFRDKLDPDHVEEVVTKLRYSNFIQQSMCIGEVISSMKGMFFAFSYRQLLEEECEGYHSDLQFLQQAIEDQLNHPGSEQQQDNSIPTLKGMHCVGNRYCLV